MSRALAFCGTSDLIRVRRVSSAVGALARAELADGDRARRFELAGNDNTHYIKLFPGENGPTGRDPVTGVKNQCLGDVGQAFLRVMLDRICGGG